MSPRVNPLLSWHPETYRYTPVYAWCARDYKRGPKHGPAPKLFTIRRRVRMREADVFEVQREQSFLCIAVAPSLEAAKAAADDIYRNERVDAAKLRRKRRKERS